MPSPLPPTRRRSSTQWARSHAPPLSFLTRWSPRLRHEIVKLSLRKRMSEHCSGLVTHDKRFQLTHQAVRYEGKSFGAQPKRLAPDLQDESMSTLDLKVPPDAVALAVGGLMWLASVLTSPIAASRAYRVPLAVALFAAGVGLIVAARVSFDRAGTTFSPIAPERSCRLVTTGVYSWSRNPMYLGTQFALLGLGVLLSNLFSLAVSAVYVLYMNRFQIGPEERVLTGRFGSDYAAYRDRVRRWA